jgi:hypothetical protein
VIFLADRSPFLLPSFPHLFYPFFHSCILKKIYAYNMFLIPPPPITFMQLRRKIITLPPSEILRGAVFLSYNVSPYICCIDILSHNIAYVFYNYFWVQRKEALWLGVIFSSFCLVSYGKVLV